MPLVLERLRGTRTHVQRAAARDVRRRPLVVIAGSFLLGLVVGTVLLMLPVAAEGRRATLVEALFTATSALCVTGLAVVDTPTHWSTFGEVVIIGLVQVGGLGIMTLASLLGLLISRRMGLQSRLVAAASTRSVGLGDVGSVLLGVIKVNLVVEGVTALVLAVRFATTYDVAVGRAAYLGAFHAISAFNNAGFALWSDSIMRFVEDPWVSLPLTFALSIGALGFPVLFELRRTRRWSRFSVHTKITLLMSAVLVLGGWGFMLLSEWNNPATFGPLSTPGKLLAGFVQGVMPRSGGFNSVDISQMNEGTWLGTDVLMFIGAGSAGTGGGIKVTTFAVLLAVIWAEMRGDPDVVMFDRRIVTATQRQALAVALLSVAAVVVSTLAITMTSRFDLDVVLYEVISAFATVGLSTGITDDLGRGQQVLLVVLMFIGRLGPVTLGTALALRERQRLFRYPESSPMVG